MPILSTYTVRHIFGALFVDVRGGVPRGRLIFVRTENGVVKDDNVAFDVETADIVPILMSSAPPGKSRSDDIADACYELAISKGWIPGEIEAAPDPAPEPTPEPTPDPAPAP